MLIISFDEKSYLSMILGIRTCRQLLPLYAPTRRRTPAGCRSRRCPWSPALPEPRFPVLDWFPLIFESIMRYIAIQVKRERKVFQRVEFDFCGMFAVHLFQPQEWACFQSTAFERPHCSIPHHRWSCLFCSQSPRPEHEHPVTITSAKKYLNN